MSELFPATLQGVVVRRKGRRILGPVDLTLEARGITIIVGPNGSGKTTLLKAIHGVERLNEGRVTWSLAAEEAFTRQAFVFQSPIMLRRSVAENLAYPLRLRRIERGRRVSLVKDWAGRIGLGGALNVRATRLSGGEQQKLAIARALIARPDVLFLDEPCANLDGRSTREIEALLHDAVVEGVTVIMSTHDLGQARRLADRALFMLGGKVHEFGNGSGIFDGPKTRELKAFLSGDILE